MSPNGRRAWRKAAKKLRWKMGRRWRSQEEWVHGKRWSELVPDLEAHRAHITGTWFKRHGFQSFDAESSSRHYIGLWGSANGETIGFVESASSITARSLVGMTMGARKRRWARDYDALPQSRRAAKTVSMLRAYGVYPKEGNPLAQKLRPCPGCCACWGADVSPADFGYYAECFGPRVNGHTKREIFRMWKWQRNLVDDCDGSGVLPARKSK